MCLSPSSIDGVYHRFTYYKNAVYCTTIRVIAEHIISDLNIVNGLVVIVFIFLFLFSIFFTVIYHTVLFEVCVDCTIVLFILIYTYLVIFTVNK